MARARGVGEGRAAQARGVAKGRVARARGVGEGRVARARGVGEGRVARAIPWARATPRDCDTTHRAPPHATAPRPHTILSLAHPPAQVPLSVAALVHLGEAIRAGGAASVVEAPGEGDEEQDDKSEESGDESTHPSMSMTSSQAEASYVGEALRGWGGRAPPTTVEAT